MLKFLIISLFFISLNANNLKIATYNVENLFDLKNDNSEYKEFIPNSKSLWNQKNFNIKIENLLKVLDNLDADIIALQEIENRELMILLQKKLPKYKYYSYVKYSNSAIGLGFLSKIEIKSTNHVDVKFRTRLFRPILETTFIYDDVEFKVFNNHWPSKAVGESYRVKYAKVLQDRVKEITKDYDYILIGDFNSDYNEFETFKKSQKLNNTSGVTGINQILNTTIDEKFVTYENILKEEKRVHYNLWLDINSSERFSTKFKNQNNTPDSILIPPALFDNKNLSYIPNSFKVFKPNYLYEDGKIIRWEMSKNGFNKIHKGEGFSDHLPIFAEFSIKEKDRNSIKQIEQNKEEIKTISDLYKEEKLSKPILINDVIVIYKDDDKAIIKRENDRAIFIYKNAQHLKLGFSYNIQVNQIYTHYGLKEIRDFVIEEEKDLKNYKDLFLDGSNINIFDFKYENEVITNLKGKVKNSKLFINEKQYIKLYAKDRNILPKNGEDITILNGHLSSFRGNMQIHIHNTTDYKVGN
ncbi:MAG: endonuclease/exonuclease/phosphatase family protein [Arcobacter sp.]|uniref:endonuclease/exonuclease/phosphatase family protein n=1 Tax=Arcobacter sp. TaxID=1872629 RepID=UPI0025887A5C|nr:endonuclease/exonuclease/phosphatase family protein [Arcobacter sp.]MDD3009283.1 endonuclease/exonuclease/phosphatase family protein [Arcobacter sp.]